MPSFSKTGPSGNECKLLETVKKETLVWNEGRRVPHCTPRPLIVLIFKSSPFSFWPTNLAETWHTYQCWCALSCDEQAISSNFIQFWLTFWNSEMTNTITPSFYFWIQGCVDCNTLFLSLGVDCYQRDFEENLFDLPELLSWSRPDRPGEKRVHDTVFPLRWVCCS